MNFNDEMKKRVTEIRSIIEKYLPQEEGFQKTLLEAMNYSMLVGGKKLRPLLMQQTYVMFGGHKRVIEPFMAAMEMIHTHSLIHDDLPAMDNDEFRRGRRTTHVVYGEDMGILAGDALLNYAFETAATAFEMEPESAPVIGKAIAILAGKAGVYGMIGGQVVDVSSSGRQIEREKLDFIYALKTGALIESSMMIGAVLAGASKDEIRTIERIASKVGLAFQIQDDILDVTSSLEVLGKPTGSDEKNHKATYVSLNGLEQSRQDVKALSEEALGILRAFPERNLFLEELVTTLINREK